VSFLVKLFTTKENLVVMNNFYHKVAVASIYTALSFTLVANKEAKAATFNLTPTIRFFIGANTTYYEPSGVMLIEDIEFREAWTTKFFVLRNPPRYSYVGRAEGRQFYEFNIDSLSLTTNTVIKRAVLDTSFDSVSTNSTYMNLDLYGYVGNGRADINDFNAGQFLGSQDALNRSFFYQDVTNFVSQRVSNGNGFAGFGIGVGIAELQPGSSQDQGTAFLNEPTLIIETVEVAEPVPEPTTIFGSALALSVGGWLKRKKSSPRNKATSQY
jgi:hypothetical protein